MRFGNFVLSLSSLVIPMIAPTATWAQTSPTKPPPGNAIPPPVDCRHGSVPANCDTLHNQQDGTTEGAGTPRAQDTIDDAPSTTGGGGTLMPIMPPGSLGTSPGSSGNSDDNDSSGDGSSGDDSSGDESGDD